MLRGLNPILDHDKIALMAQLVRDPKTRFSDRVKDYVKYRPRYQSDVVEALQSACGLTAAHTVADVGCGTGLSAEIFLQNGNRVIGVEPNREMGEAGERYLESYPDFKMLAGSAEQTSLPTAYVDFVVAGQAFHWFRLSETRAEFVRILKPGGWVVLIWHDRSLDGTPFLAAYEAFLRRHATDYDEVAHRSVANEEVLRKFFAPDEFSKISLRNRQRLDFDGLRGRLLSSSYMPREGPQAERMLQELPQLFSAHADSDNVVLEYETKIFYGHLSA